MWDGPVAWRLLTISMVAWNEQDDTMTPEQIEQLRAMRKQLNSATGTLIDLVRGQYRSLEESLEPQPVLDILRQTLPAAPDRCCVISTATSRHWVQPNLADPRMLTPVQGEDNLPPAVAAAVGVFTSAAVLFDCNDGIGPAADEGELTKSKAFAVFHTHITTAVTIGHTMRSDRFPSTTTLASVVCAAEGVWVSMNDIELTRYDVELRLEFSVKAVGFIRHAELDVKRLRDTLNTVLKGARVTPDDVANVLVCNCRSVEDDAHGDTLATLLQEHFTVAVLDRLRFEEAMICAGVGASYRHLRPTIEVAQELSAIDVGVEVWDGACISMVNRGQALPADSLIEVAATEERRLLRLCAVDGRPLHLVRIPHTGRLLLRISVLPGHVMRVEELDLGEQSTVLGTLWDSREQPPVAMYAPDERRVQVPDASDYFKNRGNDALRDRDYASAVTNYSHAIRAADPSSVHLYLSNRSAAYLYMNMPEKALEDANACIRANPDFPKGYSRQGNAFEQLGDLEAARRAYLTAMAHDPENTQLVAALEAMEARARARQEKEAASRQQQQQQQEQAEQEANSSSKDGCAIS